MRFDVATFANLFCVVVVLKRTGANFMALLTVSTESAFTEAGNSVPTPIVFHGLAANFGLCVCVLLVTRCGVLGFNH